MNTATDRESELMQMLRKDLEILKSLNAMSQAMIGSVTMLAQGLLELDSDRCLAIGTREALQLLAVADEELKA